MVKPEEYEKSIKIARKLAEEEWDSGVRILDCGIVKLGGNELPNARKFWNKAQFIQVRAEQHLKNMLEGKDVKLDMDLGKIKLNSKK